MPYRRSEEGLRLGREEEVRLEEPRRCFSSVPYSLSRLAALRAQMKIEKSIDSLPLSKFQFFQTNLICLSHIFIYRLVVIL